MLGFIVGINRAGSIIYVGKRVIKWRAGIGASWYEIKVATITLQLQFEAQN